MNKPSSDFPNASFDQWLKSSRIQPREGFRARLAERMLREDARFETQLDRLFRVNPALHDPEMTGRLRTHLQDSPAKPSSSPADWFRWLAPLSAAAILTLAFMSFQFQAPSHSPALSRASTPTVQGIRLESNEEATLTEIFALASSLHETADLSRLKSVDDLVLLFD